MTQAQEILAKFAQADISKYAIAKALKVSWVSVRLWERGVFNPKPEHLAALINLEGKWIEEVT